MSLSIYYTARRATPLTPAEQEEITAVEREFSVDNEVENYLQSGEGLNWESFTVYERDEATSEDVIFEGATALPDNTEDAIMIGIDHWTRALARIRRILHDAEWEVNFDDDGLLWDESTEEYYFEE